jgi:hypothetical protein
VADRKNIFVIGRPGHRGDEDQLTEMLAFLWQESPELIPLWLSGIAPALGGFSDWSVETQFVLPSKRRPDIRLRVAVEAVVLVESKLGADAGEGQLEDYAAYLLGEAEPTRALIFLTQKPQQAELPVSVLVDGVPVYHVRWQTMRDALEGSDSLLAHDFRVMLTTEGLVMPNPITPEEWKIWADGAQIYERIIEVLNEAQPRLIQLEPGYVRTGQTSATPANLIRIHTFENTQFSLMFSPGRYHSYEGHIGLIAFNQLVQDPKERRRRAEDAVEKLAPRSWLHYGEWVGLFAPVGEVFEQATDFAAQVQAAVDFASTCLDRLRTVGYLEASTPTSG